jgi:uncharacterized membrane protein
MSALHRVLRVFRNKFIAGLIILIPIVITAKVLWWLFGYVDALASPLTKTAAGEEVPGVGFALTLGVVLGTGLLFSAGPLRRLLDGLVDVLESVPVAGPLYGTIRKVLSGLGSPQAREAFKRFVLVRGAEGLSPGLVMGPVALERRDGSEKMVVVYIPTNHLYLGNIVVVPEADVIHTDVPVEDGISLILSAGSSFPSIVRERAR